jgi:hypothetical protein
MNWGWWEGAGQRRLHFLQEHYKACADVRRIICVHWSQLNFRKGWKDLRFQAGR